MKLQYLGDAKDSFKWDYLDHLAKALAFPALTIVPMLTPNDGGGHGEMPPETFPSGQAMWQFCRGLRQSGSMDGLRDLPKHTGAAYSVILHKPDVHFARWNRDGYFAGIASGTRRLVFADPDNGFEPLHCTEKHIRFDEVVKMLEKSGDGSVVAIFQHFRRKRFPEDFALIRDRLGKHPAAAVFWGSHLMFVTVGTSAEVIEQVAVANRRYAEGCSVVRAIR
jgi:hypothetical protein